MSRSDENQFDVFGNADGDDVRGNDGAPFEEAFEDADDVLFDAHLRSMLNDTERVPDLSEVVLTRVQDSGGWLSQTGFSMARWARLTACMAMIVVGVTAAWVIADAVSESRASAFEASERLAAAQRAVLAVGGPFGEPSESVAFEYAASTPPATTESASDGGQIFDPLTRVTRQRGATPGASDRLQAMGDETAARHFVREEFLRDVPTGVIAPASEVVVLSAADGFGDAGSGTARLRDALREMGTFVRADAQSQPRSPLVVAGSPEVTAAAIEDLLAVRSAVAEAFSLRAGDLVIEPERILHRRSDRAVYKPLTSDRVLGIALGDRLLVVGPTGRYTSVPASSLELPAGGVPMSGVSGLAVEVEQSAAELAPASLPTEAGAAGSASEQ